MRLVECIWDSRDWDAGIVGALTANGSYPNLVAVLKAGESFGDATILATPDIAAVALSELEAMSEEKPGGVVPVIRDADGNIVNRLVNYEHPSVVMQPYVLDPIVQSLNVESGNVPDHLVQVIIDGSEFVVSSCPDNQEQFRARSLRQMVDQRDQIRLGYRMLSSVTLSTLDRETSVTGYCLPVRYGQFDRLSEFTRRRQYPKKLRLGHSEIRMCDLCWPLGPLRAFLQASVLTGNPLVGYYNGHSLGL
ncbi:MAG: hypothetical protein FWD63_03445 [Propionibacteriaceae bacterium]|nr:hypothetical protein [Propionibacteriaceae bacterium]